MLADSPILARTDARKAAAFRRRLSGGRNKCSPRSRGLPDLPIEPPCNHAQRILKMLVCGCTLEPYSPANGFPALAGRAPPNNLRIDRLKPTSMSICGPISFVPSVVTGAHAQKGNARQFPAYKDSFDQRVSVQACAPASRLATDDGCQRRPRAVRTPLVFSSSAIETMPVTPANRMLSMTGRTLAA
jgi:hypothetical protein